jgi:hypothetical protein
VTGPEHLRQVAILGYSTYTATLVGDPAPFARRLNQRMRDPRPGDLVLETSTIWRLVPEAHGEWDPAALGYLLREVDEPAFTRAAWEVECAQEAAWHAEHYPDEPYEPMEEFRVDAPPMERVQYLQRLDTGGEFRWHNADFIALPTTLPTDWLGEAAGTGAVTRDSLVADLADHGFRLKGPGEGP